MLLFSCSSFSDRRYLKIENENNSTETLTAEAPYIGLKSLQSLDRNLTWLAGTTFDRNQFSLSQIEVLLYILGLSLVLSQMTKDGPEPHL